MDYVGIGGLVVGVLGFAYGVYQDWTALPRAKRQLEQEAKHKERVERRQKSIGEVEKATRASLALLIVCLKYVETKDHDHQKESEVWAQIAEVTLMGHYYLPKDVRTDVSMIVPQARAILDGKLWDPLQYSAALDTIRNGCNHLMADAKKFIDAA